MMEMEESASLSQGVFVERPRRKGKKESRVDTFGDFQPPIETISTRAKLCRTYYNRVKNTIEELEANWNLGVADQVGCFVEQVLSVVTDSENVTPLGFIPSGLSRDENFRLFDVIENRVRESIPFLARVNSSKCPSVKTGFQNICKQLLQNNSNVSHFHDMTTTDKLEETIMENDTDVTSSTRYLSIHDLQKWHESKSYGQHSLIGVIMEDPDSFPQSVIPQLLHLLSSSKVPFLFLLGGNNCSTNFGRFIPQKASTTFTYKTFQTISATQRLNKCFSRILNDKEVPFKLSGEVLSYLSSFFLSQHFSLTRLLQAYHVCLMDHFNKAEAIFCTHHISWDTDPLMSSEVIQMSYQSMAVVGNEPKPKGKTKNIKVGTGFTDIQIKEKIELTQLNFQKWMIVLNMFYIIKKKISSSTSVGSFRELYIGCASGSFHESTDGSESPFELMLADLKVMSKSSILNMLEDSILDIQEYLEETEKDPAIVKRAVSDVKKIVYELKEFLKQLEQEGKAAGNEDGQTPERKPISSRLKKATKLEDLKNLLTDKDSAFINWNRSFAKFLRDTLKKFLKPLTSISGSEVYVYQNLSVLKTYFSPLPQTDIVSALRMPGSILECDCCKETEKASIDSNLPDSSILFKLLQEQMTKKVDLSSIYEGFVSFVETREKGRKKAANSEDMYLLRFRQAVGELQLTGIIKRSKNKPDEVTKLLWL